MTSVHAYANICPILDSLKWSTFLRQAPSRNNAVVFLTFLPKPLWLSSDPSYSSVCARNRHSLLVLFFSPLGDHPLEKTLPPANSFPNTEDHATCTINTRYTIRHAQKTHSAPSFSHIFTTGPRGDGHSSSSSTYRRWASANTHHPMTGWRLWSETTELPVFTLTIKLAERGTGGGKEDERRMKSSLSF